VHDDLDDLETSWKDWKASGEDRQKLRGIVDKLAPILESSAVQGGAVNPVLYGRAKLLAAKAVKGYDPGKGAKIKTHVAAQLRSLQRDAPSITEPFAPGQRYRRELADLHRTTLEFTDKFGRDPSDEELAEVTQIPLRKIIRLRSSARARIPMSVVEEADDDASTPDVIGSTRTPYDDWAEAVYYGLGDVDKVIFVHRTGYRNGEKLDVAQISRRVGLSPEAVRKRAQRIQEQLDSFQPR
jgi:DNA-directed RNA polymerase specialized sigma subunit